MADVIQTIINSNPIRHGTAVVKANQLGDYDSLNSIIPTGRNISESLMTNRYNIDIPCSIYNAKVSISASGVESSWVVPEGVHKVVLKARTLDDISIGYSSGAASGVDRTTIFAGTAWESPDGISFKSSQCLYLTGPSGTVIEISYWL